MRILLKFVLDCPPDAAWWALRSPAVFRAVGRPLVTFQSLEEGGFPEVWSPGIHPVRARAFGRIPMGEQIIELSYPRRRDGVRMEVDSGGALNGAMSVINKWHHSMAVSATPDGRTLFRDRLIFSAGPLTIPLWPVLWVFWQWRAKRIRALSADWRS
ncbi:MAG TPA: hypothetical protein VGF80_06435 [Galbitalea sp.]